MLILFTDAIIRFRLFHFVQCIHRLRHTTSIAKMQQISSEYASLPSASHVHFDLSAGYYIGYYSNTYGFCSLKHFNFWDYVLSPYKLWILEWIINYLNARIEFNALYIVIQRNHKKNKRDEKKRLYGWSHHCDSSKNGISLARIGFASSLMSEKLRFNNSSEMLNIWHTHAFSCEHISSSNSILR